jgi:hypothetical protein
MMYIGRNIGRSYDVTLQPPNRYSVNRQALAITICRKFIPEKKAKIGARNLKSEERSNRTQDGRNALTCQRGTIVESRS